MSEPIKVGDLVQAIRWPHKHRRHNLGRVWIVGGFSQRVSCEHCSTTWSEPCLRLEAGGSVPASWVKRIPPLSELENVKCEEDLREPA